MVIVVVIMMGLITLGVVKVIVVAVAIMTSSNCRINCDDNSAKSCKPKSFPVLFKIDGSEILFNSTQVLY